MTTPDTTFTPKIEIIGGYIQGYGGPGIHWTKGVYDNRRLYYVESTSESDAAVRGERLRIKWARRWRSKAQFIEAIQKKPLDSPLCSHCGGPKAFTNCLYKQWCERSECQKALKDAIAKSKKDEEKRQLDAAAERERKRLSDIAEVDARCTGFHWRDGWYFKRNSDGSVSILHRETPTAEWCRVDITIPSPEWASIVCSVSSLGETGERWNIAQDFHGRKP